ncbi:TonB-dependent receptor [Spongiibacter taiwanensis]|uniref:TonB-dependent receptor n=1 Tax=Spongiibacter taiwanensis TaxID=1748242 RepID=UPI0020358FB3|nr:TonB-dependent receptor [Spongiibacter taiwanensis]USA42205.1 TonB-dependent receptor [Spongiibacter taiwanensis]
MRSSTPRQLLALSCTALIAHPALAEPKREEMIVTANRIERPLSTIPNTVTVINKADLDQQLAISNDLSTVLGNLIPSFSPSRQKMTNAGESLRGRKPLYMIDGVPQSNPLRNGGRDGRTIDPVVIERVEVLHGANAIHGLGAAGGIINLITRRPGDELEQSIRFDTAFQTEDLGESADYGVTYSVANRIGQADVLASLTYRESGILYDANGEVIGADNTQGDTMDSRTLNGFFKGGYSWGEQRVELTVNRFDIKGNNEWVSVAGDVSEDIPSSAEKGTLPGEGARNRVTTLSLAYSHDDFFSQHLRVQAFDQDFEATYGAEATPLATFQDPAYGPDLLDQSQNNSEKRGVKVTLSKDEVAGLPVNLVYGIDLLRDETWQALIQTGRSWVPESEYENIAPYLQAEYTGIDKVVLTSGVRHERSTLSVDDFTTLASYGSQFVEGGEPDFSETLYNLGGTYQATEQWRVFANYAEAFSMPDVGRVLRGINTPDESVEDFLDLKPILTENSEIGVEFQNEQLSAQLTYFTSDSDFGQRLQRGADGVYTVKREKTEVDGIEFRLDWQASNTDSFGLRYANTKGKYDSDGDNKVDSDLDGTNIAPDRLNLSWSHQWSYGIQSRLQINRLLDREVRDENKQVTNRFNGYTTMDLSLSLPAFGGTISAGIQNLTDKDYYTYYSQSSPNDLRNFKGIGRSYTLSYQRSF